MGEVNQQTKYSSMWLSRYIAFIRAHGYLFEVGIIFNFDTLLIALIVILSRCAHNALSKGVDGWHFKKRELLPIIWR